ncbi:BaiN/RdsA family NAD(P)/FAD-dependent oxidoreductase [Acinetobacter larvae]|uniref:Aminoacetone oxidase family FAD-binding enzyme n=1 Tax=Acinetobacter larvae TaxID=1789224 RepID=A0A1B2LWQ6_9GAMM|nr:NAD(P)/FAD-dependent oxidoreductase [Acinetobacter larvae]AOA57392.1 hypothetical protein BFG52_02790 [Acinetobacter larvae]
MATSEYDVIVLGGGASGLMLAALAGARGRRVLVLEKSNKVGKKILMSGGGKCNFTNLYVEAEHFISHNPHFVISALSRYSNWDFIGLVSDYKIAYEERKHGQLFTQNGAKEILDMLLEQCQRSQNVEILCQCDVSKVQTRLNGQFEVKSNQGTWRAQSLVVATGGLSIPTLGGSGFGYDLAKQFGHQVYPTRAGLAPFTFSDQFKALTTRLSGTAVDVMLSNQRQSFHEALLFTHRGLSGPSALQLSNYWHLGETIHIDFFPTRQLYAELSHAKKQQPKILLRTWLAEWLPKSVVLELQQIIWLEQAELPLAQIADEKLLYIAQQLHHLTVKPAGTEGYRTAEVTLGGVDTQQVSSKTMQSQIQQGLYFIGEVLDVTGHLGGYNFQWAWSSAYAAAQYV